MRNYTRSIYIRMHPFEQKTINRLISGPKFLPFRIRIFFASLWLHFMLEFGGNLQRFLHKHRAAIQFSAPLDIRFAAKIRMAITSMFQTSIYKFYMQGTRLFSSLHFWFYLLHRFLRSYFLLFSDVNTKSNQIQYQ